MTQLWMALALLQAAPATPAPSQPLTILYQPCPAPEPGREVVVCAGKDANRLPLPDEAPPSGNYVKPDSGDYRDNKAGGAPCAALQAGCQGGFGPPIVPLVAGVARLVGNALKDRREARRRDGDRRVAIALDAPPPAGRLAP